jgi:hypothetical protein
VFAAIERHACERKISKIHASIRAADNAISTLDLTTSGERKEQFYLAEFGLKYEFLNKDARLNFTRMSAEQPPHFHSRASSTKSRPLGSSTTPASATTRKPTRVLSLIGQRP